MNLTPEMIAKAKTARSAEELITIAKAEGINDLTEEELVKIYEQLNPNMGEMADDELDMVSGGDGCFDNKHSAEYNSFYYNRVCPKCGSQNIRGIPIQHDPLGLYVSYGFHCYNCSYTVEK